MSGGTALFGSSTSRSQNKNLVEFKAGKMTQKGKMVLPDTRKGLLYVYQCKDSLMHFCWKDRQSGTIEDDLIIFPEDCEFKRVQQCTTGRVYVLRFKSSSKRFFFWVQEPKTDKDEENCKRLNEVLNNPPTPGSQRSGGVTPADGELYNLLNNMSQQQMLQLLGGVGQMGGLSSLLGNISGPSTSQSTRAGSGSGSSSGSTAAASASSGATAASEDAPSTPVSSKGSSKSTTASNAGAASKDAPQSQIQLSDVRSFLSGLNLPSPGEEGEVDLSTALTVDSLQAMLSNPTVVQELQQHLPSLEETGSQQEQLRATLASSQFQQAVSMFSTALQSGQLGPVVSQLQVGDEAVQAANRGNMEDFVRALQKASISGARSSPTSASNTATAPSTPAPAATADKAAAATPSTELSPSDPVHPEKKKKMDEKTPSGPTKKEDDDDDEGMSMD